MEEWQHGLANLMLKVQNKLMDPQLQMELFRDTLTLTSVAVFIIPNVYDDLSVITNLPSKLCMIQCAKLDPLLYFGKSWCCQCWWCDVYVMHVMCDVFVMCVMYIMFVCMCM